MKQRNPSVAATLRIRHAQLFGHPNNPPALNVAKRRTQQRHQELTDREAAISQIMNILQGHAA